MIKLTLLAAATELNTSRETLRKRLAAQEISPDAEGYTIQQICRAIYGDLDGERLRKTTAEADQVEMENATARGQLVDLESFSKKMEGKAAQAKQLILDRPIPDSEKDIILHGLADLMSAK